MTPAMKGPNMTKLSSALCVAVFFGLALHAAPASAALFKTFVSGTGNDANNCDLATPCRTIPHAITQTVSGGILNCLDGTDFTSTATITASITIDCSGSGAGGGPFIINTANVVVTIKGLTIFVNGAAGIDFRQGAELTVENMNIYQDNGGGILFRPTNNAKLYVTNSIIHENPIGISVDAPAGGFATVVLDGVKLIDNTNEGFRAIGADGGPAQISVRRSVSSFNGTQGFTAATAPGGKGVFMKIDSSEVSYNNGDGVRSNSVNVIIGSSTVLGNNGTGLATYGTGAIFSFGNNIVFDNTIDGSPTGTLPLK
jgi:Right handed beta helix region